MKKRLLTIAALAFSHFTNPATAAISVIDFNGIPQHPTNNIISVDKPYTEDGFKLTTLAGNSFQYSGGTMYAIMPASPYWTGSVGLYSGVISGYGSAFSLEKQDGGAFDLVSMDAASFWTIQSGRQFDVYGLAKVGGNVFHQSFLLDTSNNTLETLVFNASFKNLKQIIFSSTYAQVDNINLSVASVPLPGSVWIMLSGLGILYTSAIRKKAA